MFGMSFGVSALGPELLRESGNLIVSWTDDNRLRRVSGSSLLCGSLTGFRSLFAFGGWHFLMILLGDIFYFMMTKLWPHLREESVSLALTKKVPPPREGKNAYDRQIQK
jgi:hypothetical protein